MSNSIIESPRNYFIKNVELNWCRLDKPVAPFGTEQYELQVATTDKSLADELRANHFNVKEKDGKFTVSLKRKAHRADGSDNGAPRVVDSKLQPVTAMIGNGSVGNVKVYQYPYDVRGKKGVGNSLTAVQIVDLIEYKANGGDFEIIEDATPAASTNSSEDLF